MTIPAIQPRAVIAANCVGVLLIVTASLKFCGLRVSVVPQLGILLSPQLQTSVMVFALVVKADDHEPGEEEFALLKKCVTKKTPAGLNDGCEAEHRCKLTPTTEGICSPNTANLCVCS